MIAAEVVYAWLVIVSPIDLPLPEHLVPEARRQAIVLDLTDSTEYVTVEEVRQWWREYGSYPNSWEIQRFPCLDVADGALTFARERVECLELQAAFSPHHADWYHDAIAEAKVYRDSWESLVWAHRTETWPPRYRRAKLDQVRTVIGESAFLLGAMPPLPYWRFH